MEMKVEKPELMAYILIVVGLLLLVFTFAMAFLMLTSVLSITTGMDLSQVLGEILGPIAEAVIKIMFLGVMGWTGSIATMRGIQLYKESKPAVQMPKPEEKPPEKHE
jgi:type IV secretory pathway VirB2 component (pilin)